MASHNIKPTETMKTFESCPIRHPAPPAYVKADQDRPQLEVRKYKARDLLNCTVGSFFDVPEDEQPLFQREAKENFLKRFDRCMEYTTEELHAQDLAQILKGFVEHMDDYFFLGSMARGAQPIVEAQMGEHKDYPGSLGQCEYSKYPDGALRCILRIVRQTSGGSLHALPDLVETSLHEMTHAYIDTFVCDLPQCERNVLNTSGIKKSQHGPTFRALSYAVMSCISQWRPALKDVFLHPSFTGFVYRPAYELEQTRIRDDKEFGMLKEFLPLVKAPSHLQLIQIREDKVIIDSKRLRVHVKKYAARPRRQGLGSGSPTGDKKESKPAEQQDSKSKKGSSWEKKRMAMTIVLNRCDPEASSFSYHVINTSPYSRIEYTC
ncbi:hypothetical protein F4810DRAFT_650107 [Camillea tinctor]|nr:hypothetical protein F4810DRAFT_650107 [Camillea tinctor]